MIIKKDDMKCQSLFVSKKMSVFDANQIEKQILWSVWLSYGYEEKLLWAVTCEKAKSYLVETSINYTSYLFSYLYLS